MPLLDYEAKFGRPIPRSFGGGMRGPQKNSKCFGGAGTVPSQSTSSTSATNSNNNTESVADANQTNVSNLSHQKKKSLAPPFPSSIFKYHISIKYVFSLPNKDEAVIEFSKTNSEDSRLKLNKNRCVHLYKKAIEQCEVLRHGGPFYYDRQSALYSSTEIREQKISLTVSGGFSRRRNFIRAEFTLERCPDDECSAEMLRSMPAKRIKLENNCTHFFLKTQLTL